MIKITGFALIILGVLALLYLGITYTQNIQIKETEAIPLPPLIGSVCIAIGLAALCIVKPASYYGIKPTL